MISFSCPDCSQTFSVSDDKVGKRTTCTKCRQLLTVPAQHELDWELLPESLAEEIEEMPCPDAPTPSASCEPTCPQCASPNFCFKPAIPGQQETA